MESLIDRTQPYPIQVPARQSAGELHVGWRSYPINVVDISWQTITVALPSRIACRIRHHSKAVVFNQGNQWQVIVEGRPQKHSNGSTTITLILADEDDPRIKRLRQSVRGPGPQMGEQRIGTDPVILAVIMIGVLVTFLIFPGWGGRWGTSDKLTDGITELLSSFISFFTNLF